MSNITNAEIGLGMFTVLKNYYINLKNKAIKEKISRINLHSETKKLYLYKSVGSKKGDFESLFFFEVVRF